MKKLIPTIALLLLSAVMLSTASYAWFSMNTTVTATGMKVTAKADSGIVIKASATNTGDDIPSTANTFKATADWAMAAGTELYPVSTVDTVAWYMAQSDEADNAQAGQADTAYTAVAAGEGKFYYAQYDYIIRSSADEVDVENVKLAVKSVTVTASDTKSESLDKAVRVAVVYDSTVYVYAPLAGANVTITPGYTASTLVAKTAAGSTGSGETFAYTDVFDITDNKIPASDTGLTVSVFIYFEGEDANCKSTNITAALDDLAVEVVFTTVKVS